MEYYAGVQTKLTPLGCCMNFESLLIALPRGGVLFQMKYGVNLGENEDLISRRVVFSSKMKPV